MDGSAKVLEWLRYVAHVGASDLHLKVGRPPFVRIDGDLEPAPFPPLDDADVETAAFALMAEAARERFRETGEADFAFEMEGLGRFRVNVFRQRGRVGLVARRVRPGVPTIDELGLPEVVKRLALEPRGLLLVTGPTGAGKTTTCAAIIEHINSFRRVHVVCIEDPIEVLHQDREAIIDQREVGIDTPSYASALRHVLRQDPDVIFVGELRDVESAETALRAAETGHLVLTTLHTSGAMETIARLVDLFPAERERQVRNALAASLVGVISQRLASRADGKGRVPVVEVLVRTGRVVDAILDPARTHTLVSIMEEGEYYGMRTFDQDLLRLLREGVVDLDEAVAVATSPHDLLVAARREGLID